MAADIEQLFCASCRSYVHPFLVACPRCGQARDARYDDVLAGTTLDLAGLCAEPDTLGAARSQLRAASMASAIGAIVGGTAQDEDPVDEISGLLGETVARVRYRTVVRGDRRATGADARFELVRRQIVLRSAQDRSAVLSVPLDRLLCVTPVAGRLGEEGAALELPQLRAGPGPAATAGIGGDLVILYATDSGVAQLALANPSGMFATKARPDHYRLLSRWLGTVAAASAEREWVRRGPRSHARDLGFDVAPEPAGSLAAGGAADGGQAPSIRGALEELEALRSGGLVTEAEYEAKRREILARL